MCELEPFLSLTERPTVTSLSGAPRDRISYMGCFAGLEYALNNRVTVVTEDSVPPRKSHPNLSDGFVELVAIAARAGATRTNPTSRSQLRPFRLMAEMRSIAGSEAHPKYDVFVSESDIGFWKICMDGTEGTPYAGGTFVFYLHADDTYPTFAPKARFITNIKHPNINCHGRICHSIFDRDWTSDTSMTNLIDSVYGLLLQPEYSDPVNTSITLDYHHDQVEFADEVRQHVSKHAKKSREQWKKEILGA